MLSHESLGYAYLFVIIVFLYLDSIIIGLTKRHAGEIVSSFCRQPHDYILLKLSADHGEAASALHFNNYLSVQVLDELNRTGATIVINYKKIRLDVNENIRRNGEIGLHP